MPDQTKNSPSRQSQGEVRNEMTNPATEARGSGSSQSSLARANREELSSYIPSPSEFFSNPFAMMRRMHEEMDRMFAQTFGGGMLSGGLGGHSSAGLGIWSPAIEVHQKDNALEVCAELPGLKPEEVHVEVSDGVLVIQGERQQQQSSEKGGVQRSERQYGRFYRSIPLPDGANTDQAKAEFRNGVLEITVPLPEQKSRRRQITIGGSDAEGPRSGTGGGTGQSRENR